MTCWRNSETSDRFRSDPGKPHQEGFGRGLALVGQDNLRRTVLREHDVPGGASIGLIDTVARYALDAGYHVVIEGILYADRYGDMLTSLVADHRGISRCSCLDIPLGETLIRHASKADADYLAHVTGRRLRDWYRERDLLPDSLETVVGADSTLTDTVDRVLHETPCHRAELTTQRAATASWAS